MTKDKIKEVKTIYSKNKITRTKVRGINRDEKYVIKPFFTGLIDKLNLTDKK